MLASTYGKGVYEMSENGEARQIYTKSNGVLKDDDVYKLLYDRQGSLWMGCLDGDLVQIPAGSRGAEGCRPDIPSTMCRIWCNCPTAGLLWAQRMACG